MSLTPRTRPILTSTPPNTSRALSAHRTKAWCPRGPALSKHRAEEHEVRLRARLERAALVVGQTAIALLGVDDPRWNARLAQPLGGTFIPMEPSHVFVQGMLHVSRNVLTEILAQLGLAFSGHRDALDHRGRSLRQDRGRHAAEYAPQPDEHPEEGGFVLVDRATHPHRADQPELRLQTHSVQ